MCFESQGFGNESILGVAEVAEVASFETFSFYASTRTRAISGRLTVGSGKGRIGVSADAEDVDRFSKQAFYLRLKPAPAASQGPVLSIDVIPDIDSAFEAYIEESRRLHPRSSLQWYRRVGDPPHHERLRPHPDHGPPLQEMRFSLSLTSSGRLLAAYESDQSGDDIDGLSARIVRSCHDIPRRKPPARRSNRH